MCACDGTSRAVVDGVSTTRSTRIGRNGKWRAPGRRLATVTSTPLPTATTRWRCAQCGNLTRFDVTRRTRAREFVHLDLSGAPTVEEREVLEEVVESVRCRWCAGIGTVELVPRPSDGAAGGDVTRQA